MWEMALASVKLFIAGKLFQHPVAVLRLSLLGVAITAVLAIGLRLAGLPLALAAGLAALGGGVLQPFLFRDLKYR
jgi:hypothetical protein